LPFLAVLLPLSLPLPVWLLVVLLFLELRSSVTLEELTSFRSSSEVLWEVVDDEETRLR